ncbi:PfkB family carbohydrate kinase (plasmid) [Pseudomonas veronii]|nr:PfkB family carbohydrate kinase [Pseudomonas veronii]WRU66192.1 PfkB family carbohydrate kinase [Pseudomonas veronii]
MISHGADGVNWFSPGTALHATPPKVSVASTVGAGDSLLAGMLHGLLGFDLSRDHLAAAPRRLPRWPSRRSGLASAMMRNWRVSKAASMCAR